MKQKQTNLDNVLAAIRESARKTNRRYEDITLVAVSKNRTEEEIRALAEAGLVHFGENRVQEAVAKIDALADCPINWHFIGSLQTNKVRHILPKVSLIHSLDRWSLVKTLQRVAGRHDLVAPCLVQVNIAAEASKSGLAPEEVEEFVQTVAADHPLVKIKGLMAIAPLVEDAEQARIYFRQMRKMFDALGAKSRGYAMEHLSMGMSGDYQVAIEEGATLVRVGTAIFGGR